MIRHVWTVAATEAEIEEETKNIGLRVLEQLNLTAWPEPEAGQTVMLPVPWKLVSMWTRDSTGVEVGHARHRLLSPHGAQLAEVHLRLEIEDPLRRLRVFTESPSLVVTCSGVYEITTEQEAEPGAWREVARVPLEIQIEWRESAGR